METAGLPCRTINNIKLPQVSLLTQPTGMAGPQTPLHLRFSWTAESTSSEKNTSLFAQYGACCKQLSNISNTWYELQLLLQNWKTVWTHSLNAEYSTRCIRSTTAVNHGICSTFPEYISHCKLSAYVETF